MDKKTLGSEFRKIRKEQGWTLLEVGDKCGVHESTVSNVERNRSIRWESVHLLLTIGLRVRPASDAYKALHALWLQQRQQKAESLDESHARKTISAHAAAATKAFREVVRGLDPAGARKALRAAEKAARAHQASLSQSATTSTRALQVEARKTGSSMRARSTG